MYAAVFALSNLVSWYMPPANVSTAGQLTLTSIQNYRKKCWQKYITLKFKLMPPNKHHFKYKNKL